MYVRHSIKYSKEIKIIHPGEYYVSDKDEFIGTLLGSCVAVCLMDHARGIAGMNHFMLPGRITQRDIFSDKKAKYGITAINNLMEGMISKGAIKNNITAKVFGGGHVLDIFEKQCDFCDDNVTLARVMMEMEDIHIISSDVGEHYTRKLLLDVKSGKVFLKKTTRKDITEEIGRRELEYVRRSFPNE